MTTWKQIRDELDITKEDEALIALEMDIIKTMVKIREEKGLTQAQLATLCGVKQPVIARLEKSAHSPQVNSVLKILSKLGYTLKVVPMEQE